MNISSLSQELNMSITELRQKIRDAGFRIPPNAQKINNTIAREIIRKLSGQKQVQQESRNISPANIEVPPFITVKDFAGRLNQPVTAVMKKLIENGVMATINEEIDAETASIIAGEFGTEVAVKKDSSDTAKVGLGYVYDLIEKEDPVKLQPRPPIVAVMGHVDHGKTTLLDTIRKTNVVATESGAITQHIGAYQVEHGGKFITFLDTPGHEAFAAMRARGANVTDLIVLVVAADDSVKPQTVEVINRAKLTKIPLIVAINKIDMPGANPERVKSDLSSLGVMVEEWGGKTPAILLSAKTGEGIDKLLEIILLTAEVEEFKANPAGKTLGAVIDSRVTQGLGATATILVQNGTLHVGDIVVVGPTFGKIRTMEDALRKKLKEARPSTPVVISGLSDVPEVGDILRAARSIEEARSLALSLQKQERVKRLHAKNIIKADPNKKELPVILRADVQGSLEAIVDQLTNLGSEEVKVNLVAAGVGEISESDVQLAENTGSVIIGFHTRANAQAAKMAKQKNVTMDQYDIIYELIEDVTEALLAIMPVEIVEEQLGRVKVKAVFRTEKDNQIVGGEVIEGKIVDKKKFRILRNKELVGTGKIDELQQNKIEVPSVAAVGEFGVKVKVQKPIETGDILEIFDETVKKKEMTRPN